MAGGNRRLWAVFLRGVRQVASRVVSGSCGEHCPVKCAATTAHLVRRKCGIKHVDEGGRRQQFMSVTGKYQVSQPQLVVPRVEAYLQVARSGYRVAGTREVGVRLKMGRSCV